MSGTMHMVIWIFTLLGLAVWSLLAWGLHTQLEMDPQWIDDVEALIRNVPCAAVIDRWIPGEHRRSKRHRPQARQGRNDLAGLNLPGLKCLDLGSGDHAIASC